MIGTACRTCQHAVQTCECAICVYEKQHIVLIATTQTYYVDCCTYQTNRHNVCYGCACDTGSDSLQERGQTCHGNEDSFAHFVQRALVVAIGLEGSVQHATSPGQSCKQGPATTPQVKQHTLAKHTLHHSSSSSSSSSKQKHCLCCPSSCQL